MLSDVCISFFKNRVSHSDFKWTVFFITNNGLRFAYFSDSLKIKSTLVQLKEQFNFTYDHISRQEIIEEPCAFLKCVTRPYFGTSQNWNLSLSECLKVRCGI